ncbi:uncharacterized protein CIMG_08489 [Coccidioides immitis RS]|uniref:Uncharacterized protein n=3 Tax=Coccidioides immitis TaxID=5501 RepID=A0A0E1RVF9_COCIM|nr:uncharacterized protein CIMG_08489 [Coccidioides immitis RS]EAS29743.2 hypothetical protein CIMG_08489 [Coccidioides immitis RS]KMP06757.1 hypothetical protein CIRG_06438 [Coccidioides immitis RMSCC 2394]KMU77012.1 hypothetical protein CISG_06247 [Coccidioides immitis RMSCC 3703]
MVFGIITAVAACPAIVGTTEAIRSSQRSQRRQEHRSRKMNLIVSCSDPSRKSKDVDGCFVVLRNHKLWIASRPSDGEANEPSDDATRFKASLHQCHHFEGYFFPHPEHKWRKGEGLVSTITADPPLLNWIYIDKDTYEMKYGNKKESEGHMMGPWDCTLVDRRMTFDWWEGFAVAEEKDADGRMLGWALYFDCDDDGLREKVPLDRRVMEVELIRREMRVPPVTEEDDQQKIKT